MVSLGIEYLEDNGLFIKVITPSFIHCSSEDLSFSSFKLTNLFLKDVDCEEFKFGCMINMYNLIYYISIKIIKRLFFA
jgi:hypothetical protein